MILVERRVEALDAHGCAAWARAPFASIIVPSGAGTPFAGVIEANPLERPPPVPAEAPGGRIVTASGWLGGGDGADFRTWSRPGWDALHAMCDAVTPELARAGLTLLLTPRAGHVLGDVQSARTWLGERAGEPVGLLLDPAALLTDAMVADAADHLERAYDALGGEPGVAGVRLTNVAFDGGVARATPVHRGVLAADPLVRFRDTGLPLVLLDDEVAAQEAVLGAAR